ncbi:MAG TPA: hypothetical protein C5S50_10125 [Methanosarcinaceae archaeon]|nr:hypothetical protein [Methanosarcinaceae archaeon]
MTDNETYPKTLQQTNRQTAINNLQDTHAIIERLMNKTYQQQDTIASSTLRQTRTKVTALLSDMKNIDIDTFSGREGTLDEFYEVEERFIESSTRFLNAVESALKSNESVDTYAIGSSSDTLETIFNNRIVLTKKHLNEYEKLQIESHNQMQQEESLGSAPNVELDTAVLSKLYNYKNILEQKYSRYQPEISNKGDYVGNRKWKIELTDKSIRGTIKNRMLKTSLIFETYWYPLDEMRDALQIVQSEANAIGKNQYVSLCLVNDTWNNEIQKWAKGFVHQRMTLFLYELENDTLIFNKTSETAEHFEFWHSTDMTRVTLDDKVRLLVDDQEDFTINDLVTTCGFNDHGAKSYMSDMVKNGFVIDIGLDSPKYTNVKH